MIATKTRAKEKPKPDTPNTPRVYSYIRFSSPEQALGDSERRQLDKAIAFAKKKGLPFDETLRMTDRGLSGYHGHHRKKGVLGHFLHYVESGLVPPGSILVVEHIDRLSREGIVDTLKKIIFKLWDYDITLQTLIPEQSYEPGCDAWKFFVLSAGMDQAHEESRTKSKRVSDARDAARDNARKKGKILTKRAPLWLEVVSDTEFKTLPGAEETLKRIFDLKLKGLGKWQIAKKLNAEASWMPPKSKNGKTGGNGWRDSYVSKILRNRAVIGEYQPHKRNGEKREPVGEPITDYYPSVVDDNTFYAVQELFKANTGTGGRVGKANNLFTYRVKCAYCGGSMAYVDKGKPPKGRKYLMCDNGRRGFSCDASHRIRYDEVEELILKNCRKLRPEEILPDPDEATKRCQSLRRRIQGYMSEQKKLETEQNRLRANLRVITDPELVKGCEGDFVKLKVQVKEVKAQQEESERELRTAESSLKSFTKWKKDLATLQKEIKKDNSVELRMQLRLHLRELIDKIEVFSVGFKELYDFDKDDSDKWPPRYSPKWQKLTDEEKSLAIKPHYFNNTETIEDELYEPYDGNRKAAPTKFRNFVKDLVKRRMSKEGRFLRIHFETGAWFDLVPQSSIASGSQIYINEDNGKSWKFVQPNIDRLWKEYKMKKS